MQPQITAKIEKLSHDGRGIAHINGKTTFIERALPSEEVSIEYLRKHSKYDEAKTIKIITTSSERVTPKCLHFGICGGCSLQHIKPETQIQLKQEILIEQLKHFAGITPQEILPPLTGDAWNYRRKARLGVKFVAKKNKVLVGFRERNGRYLADLQSCAILHSSVGTKLTEIGDLVQSLSIYDQIPQIEVACGDDSTVLIFRCMTPATNEDLGKIREFAKRYVITIYLQNKGLDSVELFFNPNGKSLCYRLEKHNLEILFTPIDFVQVNASINQQMIDHVLALLYLKPEDTVLDLFCGLGNFTLPIARHCLKVIGIEGESGLVKRAKENTDHNNIQNAQFYRADLALENEDTVWRQTKYDKILLDPPRTGAENICQYLANFGAKKIVYVSCNPATLARDCKILVEKGYILTKVGVLDMFPHTSHVESVAMLEKH
ncbi:MAG: hypothetical protein A2X78_02360 [Gammaproteobacteria bacterium GWE2_37_16]|nr:MAG: hypothetical protein A2X78_02360 [Gammaproteobacteria bacterium GWE2_37_16]